MPPERAGHRYTLVGTDGSTYSSARPGSLGGHRRLRIYGRLDCPSALQAIARGGYVEDRVFFPDVATARAAGYRPCARCLRPAYDAWRDRHGRTGVIGHGQVDALVAMAQGSGASRMAIGSGRDDGSRRSAELVAAAWEAHGGETTARVDWPEEAASWLRQARRLVEAEPDVLVLGGPAPGLAQLARRLAVSTWWSAERSLGFGGATAEAALLARGTLDGMRGADDQGRRWTVVDGHLTFDLVPTST